MKGVILHGGAGTRLRPLTFSGPKQLIPVANKPISQYVLEDLRSIGVIDVAIVLGETFPELVQQYYGDGSRFRVRISYVHQGKPLGIAHAIYLCRDIVQDDSFIVYLGDNLLQKGVKKYFEKFLVNDYDCMILLKEVDDPSRFGVAEFDDKGSLVKLVEKPKVPPSRFALAGVYFFKPVVFEIIKGLKPSWRGELEITDAIQTMLEKGYKVGYSFVDGWWLDTGKKDDILYANLLILDEFGVREIKGELIGSKAEGRVSVGEKSKIINSNIRGPAAIGSNCIIQDSFIGPYTSIGDNARVFNSSIECSIVLEGACIDHVDRLEESLVGRNARIVKNRASNAVRLHIGDYSEIEL
ncbi:MAG: glucose-1-phosphate thymidylyltransferase [Candidatus Brockarchaeota archaeon]|nr:glucose-1-phosphate thymidylyltransferase [Candidatus Brockarchaeota archaeon]